MPVLTLDKVLKNRFKSEKLLILIDAEGSEYDIINGGKSFLQRTPKPIWIIEISLNEHWPSGFNPNAEKLLRLFYKNGYVCIPLGQKMEEANFVNIEKLKKYNTHNFLFVDQSMLTEIKNILQNS